MVIANSFFASLIGIEIILRPLIFFIPGPNIGCIQIGLILEGVFESAGTVFDFSDDISIKNAPRFISFEINLIISGVAFVGVHSKT